jgi:hypothetical protein
LQEQAAEDSKQNRTLAEALKLAQAEGRWPANNPLELKLNIATYLSLLWALFGETCHLYQKLPQVYNLLHLPAVLAAKHVFMPLLCRQIMWAIYEDSQNFFARCLHPDELVVGKPISFPVSLLEDILSNV